MYQSPTIILIDDDAADRALYRRFLERKSDQTYQIVEFELGEAAIEFCQQTMPDVIVLDYQLPDCDGLEVLEQLRQWSQQQYLPVIVLTGQGSETVAVQAMKMGAQDYLVKGELTAERFCHTVTTVLKQAKLQQQLEQSQRQQQLLADIALKIRQSLKLETILQTAVAETLHLLKTDRVLVYQFAPDMTGEIVAEAVLPFWKAGLGEQVKDTCFQQQQQAAAYLDGKKIMIEDVGIAGLSECHLQLLEQFQVKASMVVPILLNCSEEDDWVDIRNCNTADSTRLWGLLVVHHCASIRLWQAEELDILQQVANQLAIAIQQAELYQNLRQLNAELQAKVVTRTTELQELTMLQQAILDGANYSIISTDPAGKITTFNQGAEKMLGYTASEVVGRVTPAILHDPDEIAEAARDLSQTFGISIAPGFEVFVARLTQAQIDEREWTYIRKDGSRFPVLLSLTALRNQQGNITGYMGIGSDITHQKQAEASLRQQYDALEQARRDAEAANRAKSEFLAMMSHEIRTPMNAVIGMTSLLLNTPLSATQQDFVETIRSSGDALLTIINDILDFSKIDSGKLELEQCPFSLHTCLQEAVELLMPQAIEKRLNLTYSIAPAIPAVVIGDVTRLRQILVNLLSNAIKFTEVGNIIVEVTADEIYNAALGGTQPEVQYEMRFTVRDTGIGIPADRIERLFKLFSQVDASINRQYGGTGLGLVISQRLCQLMGGEMWVESQVGLGSTFHFTIRLTTPRITSSRATGTALSIIPVQSMTNQIPLKILLAEDHVVNQKVALLMLQHLGYRADVAANGLEVLEALRQNPYDVVLLDVQMPEMDGLTAARHICQEWTITRPRLIAMTANAMQGDRQLCLDAGMDDYLSKPVRMEALIQALSQCRGIAEGNGSRLGVSISESATMPAIETNDHTQTSQQQCMGAIVLEELQTFRQNIGNDNRIFVALLTHYLEEAPCLLQNLNKAIAQGDQTVVNRTAHTLKSTSATLGAAQLAALCQELEQRSQLDQHFGQYHPELKPEQSERQQNQFEYLLRVFDQIETEYQRVKMALKQVIQIEK